jgi:hypothetical protein
VFRSFRTESITKYTLSFVTAPCILSSLCSRSRRFWMHRRNWRCGIACRTASCFSWSSITLWKRRWRRQEQITRGQIGWASRVEDHSHVLIGQNSHCSCKCVGNRVRNLRSSARSESSRRFSWYVPYERTNMSAISEMVLYRSSLNFFFEPASRCWLCYLWRNDPNPHNLWRSVLKFGVGNPHRKVCFPHGIAIERWFEHLVRFQYSFSGVRKQTLTKTLCFFKSTVRKSPIARKPHIYKCPSRKKVLWLQNSLDWLRRIAVLRRHLVTESCVSGRFRSRGWVRELLDRPSCSCACCFV